MVDLNSIDTQIASTAANALDSASGAVMPVVWSIIGLVLLLVLLWYLMHRHTVRLRVLTSHGSVLMNDKAREVIVDGVPYWKLLKKKAVLPVPPSESLMYVGKDLLGKQKFYVEMYFSEEDGFIPIVDRVNKDNLRERIEQGLTDSFHPFRPSERALLVSQLRKAEARKKKSWMDTLAQLAVPLALIFIVIIGLVFWEDIAKPGKEIAEINSAMMESQQKMMNTQLEIANQNARMVQALTGQQIPITQPVGADS